MRPSRMIIAILVIVAVLVPANAKIVAFKIDPEDTHWYGLYDPAHLLQDKGEYYYVNDYMPYNHPKPVIFLKCNEFKYTGGNFTFTWARTGYYGYGIVSVYASNDSITWIKIYPTSAGDEWGYGCKKTVTVDIPKGYTFIKIGLSDAREGDLGVKLWKNATIKSPESPMHSIPGFEATLVIMVSALTSLLMLWRRR